ncbi:MAG: GSCFA domain-containing protein [Bacteroidetes bacterium]|nr:GSCFA domain-containing protein [Bacteroidota bacterium]
MKADELKSGLITPFPIEHRDFVGMNDTMFFMGSCFTENMGRTLHALGLATFINPFGILYNPVSMARAIEQIATGYVYTEADLFYHNGLFLSFDHHGKFEHPDAGHLLELLNRQTEEARIFLSTANIACLTLGTAYVWYHVAQNQMVANCHKVPGREFQRYLLTETEVKDSLVKMRQYLKMLNPGIRLLFTISPVKHLKEGITQNALSKARLLSALCDFMQDCDRYATDYFPAFEIVNEELRDHRFYAEDLAHPSRWTVQYIAQRFAESRMDAECIEYAVAAARWNRMENHQPMDTSAESLQKWNAQKTEYLREFRNRFPGKVHWPWRLSDGV